MFISSCQCMKSANGQGGIEVTTNKKAPAGWKQRLSNTRLQVIASACRMTSSKQSRPAMTSPLYTKSITGRKLINFINALVSPKHCESVSFPWKQPFKNAKFVLRVALLIFKSGLNRILLTELRSGAATPKKMFLMLARLSEITNKNNGHGQQQLLIDNHD